MESQSAAPAKVPRAKLVPSTRLSVYLMLCLTTLTTYAIRQALNMNIVCMVVPVQEQIARESNTSDSSEASNSTVSDTKMGDSTLRLSELGPQIMAPNSSLGVEVEASNFTISDTKMKMGDSTSVLHELGSQLMAPNSSLGVGVEASNFTMSDTKMGDSTSGLHELGPQLIAPNSSLELPVHISRPEQNSPSGSGLNLQMEPNVSVGSRDGSPEPTVCAYTEQKEEYSGHEGEFYWSRMQVGYLLAAYVYGYIPMQLLSGWMADKLGVRHVLGTGQLIGGILCLLTPVAARTHYGLLVATRFLLGFIMGTLFPCCHTSIGKWVPPYERMTFLGVLYMGPGAGTMLAFVLSGYLCQFGWTLVFYVLGVASLLCYVAFLYVIHNSPAEHPRISEVEKVYINTGNRQDNSESIPRAVSVPWRKVLTSRSVLGACVTHLSHMWMQYTIAIGIPLYMQDVLQFNIEDNGLLSSVPSLLQMCTCPIIGVSYDYIHRKVMKSRHLMRKLCHTVFTFGVGISIAVVSVLTCEQRSIAVASFCSANIFMNFISGGFMLTPSDIAPRFAGSVFGAINFIGNFAGFLVPITIGSLTPNGSQAEWQRMFLISGAVVVFGWLVFVFGVKHEEEDWAKESKPALVSPVPVEDQ